MEDDVYNAIRTEFLKGSDEKQAFLNICEKRKLGVWSEENVNDWLKRLHNASLEGEIGRAHYDLLWSIIGQYSKFKHAMFYCDDWKGRNETIISNRFIFFIQRNAKTLTLVDSFNKDSRQIQVTQEKWRKAYFPAVIDDEHILLVVKKNDGIHLVLFDIDFDKLKYSILDEVLLNVGCHEIILDSSDNSRFLLCGRNDGSTVFYKGHLAGGKIYFENQGIEFGARLFGYKLMGDQVSAFRVLEDEQNTLKFFDYDISSNVARKVNECFIFGSPTRFASYNFGLHIWKDNKMYVELDFDSKCSIIVFDADSLKWSKTKFVGIGFVEEMLIDEDHILTVSMIELLYDLDQCDKTIYRFPMRKPDKLSHLAWSTIRRGSFFFGSDIYDKLFLPYNSEFRSIFGEE